MIHTCTGICACTLCLVFESYTIPVWFVFQHWTEKRIVNRSIALWLNDVTATYCIHQHCQSAMEFVCTQPIVPLLSQLLRKAQYSLWKSSKPFLHCIISTYHRLVKLAFWHVQNTSNSCLEAIVLTVVEFYCYRKHVCFCIWLLNT